MAAHRMDDGLLTQALAAYATYGSSNKAAMALGIPRSTFLSRYYAALAKKGEITPSKHDAIAIMSSDKARFSMNISDGIVLVGSDAHYWPGHITTAHRAFVRWCEIFKPTLVVMNGDVFDGSGISRFARIGWDHRPTVKQELEAVKDRLGEIEKAATFAKKAMPLGNHDARFETRLANEAPQYEGIEGFHLKDHLPGWHPCWGVWINDEVVIKHRWKGGIHASYQNTLQSGVTLVTGHLHSLQVRPYTDYRGTRYGVDTGTLAEPRGPQFTDYTEDNPKNWRSGFVMLTFYKGQLLQPELCQVIDEGLVDWRGGVVEV